MRLSWASPPKFGARGKLYLEGRALPEYRFDPDATTMHLHDLLGDREPEPSATSGLGQRAVDLMELLENARALLLRDAWASIRHADVEATVHGFGGDAHLARVGELDGVADEVQQYPREALLIPEANRDRFVH